MTKKELLDLPAFKQANDDAEIWIQSPSIDDYIPTGAWVLPFADGSQNLIIQTKEPEETWLSARRATKVLNAMKVTDNPKLVPERKNDYEGIWEEEQK